MIQKPRIKTPVCAVIVCILFLSVPFLAEAIILPAAEAEEALRVIRLDDQV
ncbi:MAG: hypothetical protein PVI11_01615 [Candidatus Aminicenantes bacterium]